MVSRGKSCTRRGLIFINNTHSNPGTEIITIGVGVGENASIVTR
jgi:hypothetical protein